ncbi:MAG: tRNA (guanine(10)-N(2))-dimethyltransferase [Methanobacteriaceae archaeon]
MKESQNNTLSEISKNNNNNNNSNFNSNNTFNEDLDHYTEKEICEGLTKIIIPEFDKVSSKAPVFYNPVMELNRDLSILAIQTFQEELARDIHICDVFGGSGIRGIRYKNEINGVEEVAVNDISSLAIEFTKKNAITNNVEITTFQNDANITLRENRGKFDVIDIDPFGTPSYFTDSAAYSLKKDSLLCITATDTSALCGTYKEPCIRKYNAKPLKTEYCHENGIRILGGFVALTLAKYKKYMEVLFSHSSEHYMRLYLRIKKGSAATDNSLNNIGYIGHCKKCLYRETSYGIANPVANSCPICSDNLISIGPLWLGLIQNKNFITAMLDKIDTDNKNNINDINKNNNIKDNNKIINTNNNINKTGDDTNATKTTNMANKTDISTNTNTIMATEDNINTITTTTNINSTNSNRNTNSKDISTKNRLNNSNSTVNNIIKINTSKKATKLLETCLAESEAPITFYELHKICKKLKISAPKFDKVMKNLANSGFIATKTHFNPLGIKTNANITEIENIVLNS